MPHYARPTQVVSSHLIRPLAENPPPRMRPTALASLHGSISARSGPLVPMVLLECVDDAESIYYAIADGNGRDAWMRAQSKGQRYTTDCIVIPRNDPEYGHLSPEELLGILNGGQRPFTGRHWLHMYCTGRYPTPMNFPQMKWENCHALEMMMGSKAALKTLDISPDYATTVGKVLRAFEAHLPHRHQQCSGRHIIHWLLQHKLRNEANRLLKTSRRKSGTLGSRQEVELLFERCTENKTFTAEEIIGLARKRK